MPFCDILMPCVRCMAAIYRHCWLADNIFSCRIIYLRDRKPPVAAACASYTAQYRRRLTWRIYYAPRRRRILTVSLCHHRAFLFPLPLNSSRPPRQRARKKQYSSFFAQYGISFFLLYADFRLMISPALLILFDRFIFSLLFQHYHGTA